jgi:hypothetical protein
MQAFEPNIRLEQTAGKSRFNVKVHSSPTFIRAAAQAGRCSGRNEPEKNLL